jgi:hypothetical protein
MTGHRKGVMDVIPVDLTSNLLIAVGWRTAKIYQNGIGQLTVYNCTSGAVNPLKWGELGMTHRIHCLFIISSWLSYLQKAIWCIRSRKILWNWPFEGQKWFSRTIRKSLEWLWNIYLSSFLLSSCRLMHNYWMSVSHLLPAYIFDMAMRLVGKKPRCERCYFFFGL